MAEYKIDNRYKRIKELGSGFSGEVLLVEDETGQKACKLLKSLQFNVSSQDALANFKSEFSILSELNHPGIARILDFGYDSYLNKYYFTSELITGTDFFKATEGKSIEVIENLAVQIFRALNYLHSRGIYHLDIKPQNILVQEKAGDLQAKIIDFGLSTLSPTGKMVGTPAYMAPELTLGNKPDGRADLYSFGVLLYKAFTRVNPFASKNLKETFLWQQTLTPKLPSEINPKVPAYWDRILMRLLEKQPSNRYAQASFAIRDINFLANKNFEIETIDTRRSYLLDKGHLIGRKKETEIFKNLFELTFKNDSQPETQLLIIEGKEGCGKSRLLSDFKYFSQLQAVPVFTWKQFKEENPQSPFLLIIDDPLASTDQINLTLQKAASQKILILWATSQAPVSWARCEKISLQNFTEQEVSDYVAMVTGLTDPPHKLVKQIFERTEGNPLFVTELLKTLLENNLILDSMGRWASATFEDIQIDFDKIEVPHTVAELLTRKYQSLKTDEKNLVEWMAILNRPLSVSDIQDYAGIEKPQLALLTLTREDMIERNVNGYFFKTLLLRDTILATLPHYLKRTMHDKAATLLEGNTGKLNERLHHLGHGVSDKQAIDALLQLGNQSMDEEKPAHAIEYFSEAWMRAQNQDIYSQIETELKLSEALIYGRNYKRAITHYGHLKELFDKNPELSSSSDQRVDICEKMGDLYVKLDAFDEALELFNTALKIFNEGFADRVHSMIIENHKANALRLKGLVKEAEEIFLKNYEEWLTFSDEDKRKVTNNRLADTFLMNSEHDMALRQAEKDIEFFTSINNQYLLARSYYLRGDIFYRLMLSVVDKEKIEKEKLALASFEKCLSLAKIIAANDLVLRSYNGIGNLYWEKSDFKLTADYYERALALARKLEDFKTAAILSLNLGNMYKSQKNLSDAYSHLVYAINTYESMPNKNAWNFTHLFQSYLELAETHREMNDLNKSEEYINRAGSLVRTHAHLLHYEFSISFEKAKLFRKKGNKELYSEYIKKARALAKEGEQMNELNKYEAHVETSPADSIPTNIDITSAKPENKPTEINKDLKAMETILKINTFINSEHDPEHLLKMVLNYALELSGAESGLVLLADSLGQLHARASVNTDPTINITQISQHVAQEAIESGEAIIVDNALVDDRFDDADSVILNSLKSILCMPIRSKNKIVGVFYLDNRHQSSAFQNMNMRMMKAFCDQVGIALENARLFSNFKSLQNQLEQKLEKTTEELSEVREILKTETSVYLTKYSYNQIISRSKPMRDIFKILDKITETNLSVFIKGASGTGKELIARALHYNNPLRATKRFMAINCGAIPANLIESELFGYKAGSFTGAQRDKKGIFEEANGGTLFLDEIADLDMNLQVKLLRVLQEGEVQRIGDTHPIKVDVRIVNASHKDIEDMVKKGVFREDLYFRLCQIKIELPPLCERKEDIPLLVDHLIEKFRLENRIKEAITVHPSFLKGLLQYNWPGNIRELDNLIAVACALRTENQLTLASIPPNHHITSELKKVMGPSHLNLVKKEESEKICAIDDKNNYEVKKTWSQYEILIIAKCYEANGFKKVTTADMLGISHSTLYKKIGDNNLDNKENEIYKDPFVYTMGTELKDYIPLVFKASLEFHDNHPYAAIRTLGISQGYFYKILKNIKESIAV